MAKDILQKSTKLKQEFNYSKGAVALGFTLSMENTSELRAFLSCLIEAQKDVKEQIAGMKN